VAAALGPVVSWVRYDDGFSSHPKVCQVIAEEPGALALHVLGNTWSSTTKRPGFIPTHQPGVLVADKRKGARWAVLLERAGLWDKVEGGWEFHDHADYRESAARSTPGTPAGLSEKRRAAGRQGGRAAQRGKQTEQVADSKLEQTEEQSEQHPSKLLSASEQVAVSPVVASNEATNPNPLPTAFARKSEQTAAPLIAEWINACNGAKPPDRVKGQVARLLGELLAEGQPYDAVRAGLARWHDRRLNPSLLPSVVHEVAQGPPRATARPSNFAAHLALAERLENGTA